MKYAHQFHELAQLDYEDALLWYLRQNEKAAMGFVKAIDDTIFNICNYPIRHRKTYKHFHETIVKRYPYLVIYTIENDKNLLIIWKIFHFKNDPKKKYSGLKNPKPKQS